MDVGDTNLLIYNDNELPPINPRRRTNSGNEKKKDGFQEFLDKIRFVNGQGPYYIHGNKSDDRKLKDQRRLIKKNGKYNVSRHVESQIWDKYLRDICNTLVQSRWRWTILTASSSFILSWLIFAVIWMLIANANGDHDIKDPSLKCLLGINSFAGYFMFSLETQTTIGYGGRSLNDHCPEAVFIVCLQIIMGVAICSLMINIVYIKMTKSQNKYSKLFSRHAIICRRDGELCLIFRVRDEDSRHAIGTLITAYVLRKDKETGEPYLETISLEPYGFLIWPLEIVHKITPSSPLWDISSYNLLSDKFEVIVTMQGTSPTTGQCSRTRTSYISSEILWGHKFKNCVRFVRRENAYVVNQTTFNATEEHSTHLCSAKRFAEVYTSLSPTPKNFQFKLNILYSSNQRGGTLLSVESIDNSNLDEQSETSKDAKEKVNHASTEKIENDAQNSERPRSPKENPENQNAKTNQHRSNEYQDPYEERWEYQNYSGNPMPDFWLKEAASLPLINNYEQDQERLQNRKFGSDIHHLKAHELLRTSSNLDKNSKEPFTSPRVFDWEEFIFESNNIGSDISLTSAENSKANNTDPEHDPELDEMMKSMESFLERHFDPSLSSSTGFPKE